MNNMFSKSAIWVVVVLLLLMLYKQFDSHGAAGGARPIAYSELLDAVKSKNIKEVVIEGANITAVRSDDTKVRTTATVLDRGLIGVAREVIKHSDAFILHLPADVENFDFGKDPLTPPTNTNPPPFTVCGVVMALDLNSILLGLALAGVPLLAFVWQLQRRAELWAGPNACGCPDLRRE